MSFEFINGVTPNPIKEKPVVKNNKPKYDPNNPSKDMDIALQNLRKNIILKYRKGGGFNPDKFDLPKPIINKGGCNFSFARLKTAVLRYKNFIKTRKTMKNYNKD